MKVHVIPAWIARNKTSEEVVYQEEVAFNLKNNGYQVVYQPQEAICELERSYNPKLSCRLCVSGYTWYYLGRN